MSKYYQVGLYDVETKEILKGKLILWKQNTGGRFVKLYIRGINEVMRHKLSGEGLRILLILQGSLGSQNQIPEAKKIAELARMKLPNVYRAYKELKRAGFLVQKENRSYHVNPLVCWNGSVKTQEQAIQELFPIPKPTAALPAPSVYEPRVRY